MKLLRFIKLLLNGIGKFLKAEVWPTTAIFIPLMGIFWVIGGIANLLSPTYSKWMLARIDESNPEHMNSILMYISVGGFTVMFPFLLALVLCAIYGTSVKIKEYWNKA
jgi:membrane protein insertase Oxa1/YidC/SpoIIIJ